MGRPTSRLDSIISRLLEMNFITLQGINIFPPWEKENHLQKWFLMGYVSSLKGKLFMTYLHSLKLTTVSHLRFSLLGRDDSASFLSRVFRPIFRGYPSSQNHGSVEKMCPCNNTFQRQPVSTSHDYGIPRVIALLVGGFNPIEKY